MLFNDDREVYIHFWKDGTLERGPFVPNVKPLTSIADLRKMIAENHPSGFLRNQAFCFQKVDKGGRCTPFSLQQEVTLSVKDCWYTEVRRPPLGTP